MRRFMAAPPGIRGAETGHPDRHLLSLWFPHRDRRQVSWCSLFGEHPERLADNGIVLDLAPMPITEGQNRDCWVLFN